MRLLNFKPGRMVLLVAILMAASSCDVFNIKDRSDPNNISLDSIQENPTRDEVNIMVTGTESSLRTDLRIYYINVGMIGREMYRFLAAEPRNTGDLLGKGNSVLDNNSFYTTRPWAAFYASVRNANILLASSATSTALSDAEKSGVAGFAKTMKAYEFLMTLSMTYNNGIRTEVEDLYNPGPIRSRDDALSDIASLLDDAATDLDNAGSEFSFRLSEGFSGFDTPATFREFNRALAARVAVYRGNFGDALNILQDSFLDPTGSLTRGVYHVYSTASGDQLNPIYADPDASAGDSWLAHPSFVADAEAGDTRLSKVQERTDAAALDGLSSDYGLYVYKTQTDPVPIIRNEELVLIRAEARIQTDDLPGGESDLNIIRNAAGLPDYGGAQTQAALIDEMLRQRRYSLFMEGHRWVDMRRYDRLDQLPLDRPGDNVWVSFPIPRPENVGN